MRSLFLICRHGETFLNESGKYRGFSNGPDAHLNEDGVQSAEDAGLFLQKLNQKFSRIISSPLERAVLTACIIAKYLNLQDVEIDDRLLPLNVGDLAGKSKEEFPIYDYLRNKNKKFPGGESVREFEVRQKSFADELLKAVSQEKLADDPEILIVAHVSNAMFWHNIQSGANSEDYLGETTDIISPGGIAMVTEYATIPVFKSNPQAETPFTKQIDTGAVKGEPGTGYEPAAGKGPFSCANCEYFKNESCGQKDMMRKSKQPRTSDGRVKVDPHGCCEYVERIGK